MAHRSWAGILKKKNGGIAVFLLIEVSVWKRCPNALGKQGRVGSWGSRIGADAGFRQLSINREFLSQSLSLYAAMGVNQPRSPMDIVRAPSTEGLKLREINRAGQEEFASLVSRCFGYAEDQQDFLRDFPVWNQDLNSRVERLGYYHEGKLIAAVAGRTCTLRGIVQGTPIGIIGAVVTSPEWRATAWRPT
jgi:hypothetical protein